MGTDRKGRQRGGGAVSVSISVCFSAFVLPLPRQRVLLFAVTLLTGRDEIPLGRPAATDQRDEVVHRQFLGREAPLAVEADPRGPFALPPFGPAQLARAVLLPLNVSRADI